MRMLCCLLVWLLVGGIAAAGEEIIFPRANADFKYMPSDNGSDTHAFTPTPQAERIEIAFRDQENQDNYLHIDLGALPLNNYLPGGYIEIEADLDHPILRICTSISIPEQFWPMRKFIESEAPMKTGLQTYRFYLNNLTDGFVWSDQYHLYLFLHDFNGKARGACTVKINRIALYPQTSDWKEQMTAFYRKQYELKDYPDLGQYYRGKYDLLTDWDALNLNPALVRQSLDGPWQKAARGDRTWDYAYLKDTAFAAAGIPLAEAQTVQIPEPASENQTGGHYEYKRTFTLQKKNGDRVYLRIGDLADSADVYINGERVGTQSSVRKRHEWVIRNGGRNTITWEKPVREVIKWQHFERCGIACPYDATRIPDDDEIMLPIYTGQYDWPDAFEITNAARAGENTIAIRLYGCPVKGWWIFKNGEDRAARNVFGLLGSVTVLTDRAPVIEALTHEAQGVDKTGLATHRFSGKLQGKIVKLLLSCEGQSTELAADANGNFTGTLTLPADFRLHLARVDAVSADGSYAGTKAVEFTGSVIRIVGQRMMVNGEPFFTRGLNGNTGVEFDKDRAQTRREWLRGLNEYHQLGFNALRLENVQPHHLRDALAAGMLVLPVYASASCNSSLVALGNLDKPDYEFNTDAHREMAILLWKHPNIFMWNSGNENHHTSAYTNDKETLTRYLEVAQQALRRFDPARRPVTYSNLDTYGIRWFFTGGQDVIGYNSYQESDILAAMMRSLPQESGMNVIFTEWGIKENETRGTAYRNENIARWEKGMIAKEEVIRTAPGSLGGFLYAHHGEMKDERGRTFIQNLMLPFTLRRDGANVVFTSRDICTFRGLALQLCTDDATPVCEYVAEFAPGANRTLALPNVIPANAYLRIVYETHRGLRQEYIRPLPATAQK